MGAYSPDEKENTAFLSFSRHFLRQGLPVPAIYAANETENIYLIEDIGDTTLFSYITENRSGHEFTEDIINYYKKVITALPKFQVLAAKGLDFNVCYPRAQFDKQSMQWDLSYFKYYFLKLAKISFDEQKLRSDFQSFTDYFLQTD